MNPTWRVHLGLSFFLCCGIAGAQEARLVVHANQVSHHVSPYLAGACIEDVNHEIYGGLYSQMIFGEGFQEPAPALPPKGFTAWGGRWQPKDDALWADAGDGPKLISDEPAIQDGEIGVEVLLPERKNGNAGLIVKASEPGVGADKFVGYEIALDPTGHLVVGRHRQNWEPIREVPCDVPANEWIKLVVRMTGPTLTVLVNGRILLDYNDQQHPLTAGKAGLRTWQCAARFRNLYLRTQSGPKALPFERDSSDTAQGGVSGMWRSFRRGSANGAFSLENQDPFAGSQSQRLTFKEGRGEVGLENKSLNRWGMNFIAGKRYEGFVWLRADQPTDVFLALESGDGTKVYGERRVRANNTLWHRLDFTLTPVAADKAGRFTIKLKEPGSVCVGHAFLQPGEWGRFKTLPVRKDVAETLVAQGITVLRYGGSMINHAQYRWKKMIGPPDRRPPYCGTWYPHSSNGWGIFDFLNFCEAGGFLAVPAVNVDESPQDLADFVEYANGPVTSKWGRQRAADGHPAPYSLKYLELGNEEAVNESYWQKFKPLAEAIWAQDPALIVVVGDFAYEKVIQDPYNFEGAPSIKSLAAHKKILDLAGDRGREVWFDVHIGTEAPPDPRGLPGVHSFIEQLERISPGANFKVAIFEFNAGNHGLKRALANACAVNQLERLGDRIGIACSANCLQPDQQNDNGWDQGLLFLNPAQVWPQPPYYVTGMFSRNYLPLCVKTEVQSRHAALDVNAKRSDDGKTLVLQVVNVANDPVNAEIVLDGFVPRRSTARVTVLAGDWDAVNTAERPDHVRPRESDWRHDFNGDSAKYTFPARSFTTLRLDRAG